MIDKIVLFFLVGYIKPSTCIDLLPIAPLASWKHRMYDCMVNKQMPEKDVHQI